jgi:hypothetical protein
MMAICITPQGCVLEAANSFWTGLADATTAAAGQMVTTLFAWWTTTPPLDLNTVITHTAQRYVTEWIALPVAVLAVLAAVGWGVLGSGVAWIGDIARGLLVFGIVTAGSLPIVAALQTWSSSLAKGILSAVPTHDVGGRIITLLDLPGGSPLLVIFWGILVLLAAAIQYVMMLFRDGAVLVLTAVLPLAAAGQFNRASLLWLPKVTGWLMAFIFLKPAAALIYYLGLSLIGQGQGLHALVTAICMMVTAIFALPAMLRLVTFATAAAPMGSGALTGISTASGFAVAGAQFAGRPTGAATAALTGTANGSPAGSAAGGTSTGSAAGGTAGGAASGTAAGGAAAGTAGAGPAGAALTAASSTRSAVSNAVHTGKDPE